MSDKIRIKDDIVIGTRVRCWDFGPSNMDRYTILYMSHQSRFSSGRRLFPGMQSCSSTMSISGHLEAHPGRHLGKRIPFAELPEPVRRMIRNDLAEGGE